MVGTSGPRGPKTKWPELGVNDLRPVRAVCAVLRAAPDYGIGEGRGRYTDNHDQIDQGSGNDIRPSRKVQCVSMRWKYKKDVCSTKDALGDGGGVEDGRDGPDKVYKGMSDGNSPDSQSQSQPEGQGILQRSGQSGKPEHGTTNAGNDELAADEFKYA